MRKHSLEVAELLAGDTVAEWQDLQSGLADDLESWRIADAAFEDFLSGEPIPE
jgi:hypothetical protein